MISTPKRPRYSAPEFLRALMPAPDAIALGTDAETGEDISLPVKTLTRNISAEAETGQGKTALAQELAFTYPFSPMSLVNLDYIGTGFDWSAQFVALMGTILQVLERMFPLLSGATDWFLSRHAFGVISYREESDIKIDILKRRLRPDGERESVPEVVERVLSVFSVRFADMSVRVRFRRVATSVLTCLCAGERSISEYHDLLHDFVFRGFVLAEIARFGLDRDEYVVQQIRELERLCAMQPRPFEEQTESFMNAMQDYAPGTALGKLFGSEETFDPRLCAFGDARLYMTTDLPNPLLRREAFLSIHAIMQSMFTLRRVGTGSYNRCFYILDEVAQWADPTLFTLLAMGRNLKVSTFLLYQSMAQWKDIGFPNAAEILPSVCRLQGHWRPTTFNSAKDLAIRSNPIDPMGLLFREHVKSIANGESATDTLTRTWSETKSRATSLGTNEGLSSGSSWGESASLDALGAASGSGRNTGSQMGSSSGRTSSITDTLASLNGTSEGRSMGRSITNTLAEMLIRIPTDEQLTLHAQRLMRQREHRATWLYEGKSITVDMYPPRQYSANLFGLPLDAWYADWRRTYYAGRAERRVPFVRQPILVAAPARSTPATSRTPAPSGPASPAPALRLVPAPDAMPPVVTPVEHRAFPPFPIPATGLAKTIAMLQIAHVVRLLTVNHVIALTGWSYDKAYRELDAGAEAKNPLLDRIKPPAARGQGSAPTIYILAPAGARLLAAHGGDERELLRIVKNNADHRRVVEDHLPHQGRHRLYGATLLAFLATAAHTRDLRIIDVRGDREVFDPIDLTPFVPAMQERERPDPTRPVRYVPDLAFTLSGASSTQRYYVEIETGFGQRDERFLGRVKAWKMRALAAARGAEMPRILVWTRTANLEDQFVEGATAVLDDAAAGFVFTTNGEALPLATPPGVNKRERAESVRVIAAHAAGPVWRALRDPKGARAEILGS
jgi:hypothetical protein